MNPIAIARRLRRAQTGEEKQLWRALKAGRFAGFKFRRQHPQGKYFMDFNCPTARVSVELDGFQHGLPEHLQRDAERARFLAAEGIEELRFWNHQWRKNRQGVLLDIWAALHRRTGCVKVMRMAQNHRFVPPKPEQLTEKPAKQPVCRPRPWNEARSSPRPSPPAAGGEGEETKALWTQNHSSPCLLLPFRCPPKGRRAWQTRRRVARTQCVFSLSSIRNGGEGWGEEAPP